MAEERMHKMVNGKKVFLTEEEEKAIKAEWEKNRLENQKKKAEKAAKIKKINDKKASAKAKLKALGLDDEEIDALSMKVPRLSEEG